ncbi:MAG: hypothetical protein ACE14V_04870 [bacterium]
MNLGFGPGRKSPTLARWFSIVPGLGHIYVGAYLSGTIWLFIALFLLLSISFGYIDLYAVGSGRTIVIGYYIYMILWCCMRAGQLAVEKNQQLANQEHFKRQKETDEQDKQQAIQTERLKEEAVNRLHQQ